MDNDLENRLLHHIEPILLLGQAMIEEKHPAAGHIKVIFINFNIILLNFNYFFFQTYTDTLNQHFNWVKQLSYLLSLHLKCLYDYESVRFKI